MEAGFDMHSLYYYYYFVNKLFVGSGFLVLIDCRVERESN